MCDICDIKKYVKTDSKDVLINNLSSDGTVSMRYNKKDKTYSLQTFKAWNTCVELDYCFKCGRKL